MIVSDSGTAQTKHNLITRITHVGLALTVMLQLLTSLIMQGPGKTLPGDFFFKIHEYGGITALLFALLFWLSVMKRRFGTPFALLIPWFSTARRIALWQDTLVYSKALRKLRLPLYDESSPLASAVHGLGLLLMSFMAVSGTVFYGAVIFGMDKSLPLELLLELHKTFGNLVWAYLIGHAGLAVIHHYTDDPILSDMWSFHIN